MVNTAQKKKARPLRPRLGGGRALLSGRPRARSGVLDGRPRLTRCTRARRYSLERPSRPVPWCNHGSVEPISPILPSCVEQWQSTGSFPSPVGDRDHSTCRHRIPRGLGKAHRETRPYSGGRATPALGLAARHSRRHLQEPSDPEALTDTPSSDSWAGTTVAVQLVSQALEPPEPFLSAAGRGPTSN